MILSEFETILTSVELEKTLGRSKRMILPEEELERLHESRFRCPMQRRITILFMTRPHVSTPRIRAADEEAFNDFRPGVGRQNFNVLRPRC